MGLLRLLGWLLDNDRETVYAYDSASQSIAPLGPRPP